MRAFPAEPSNVYLLVPSVLPPATVSVKAWPTLSAVPAVAGLPTDTVCAVPPLGVTVKLPAVPFANLYVVLVFVGTAQVPSPLKKDACLPAAGAGTIPAAPAVFDVAAVISATDPEIVTVVLLLDADSVKGAVPDAFIVPTPPKPDKVGAAGIVPVIISVIWPELSAVIPVTTLPPAVTGEPAVPIRVVPLAGL